PAAPTASGAPPNNASTSQPASDMTGSLICLRHASGCSCGMGAECDTVSRDSALECPMWSVKGPGSVCQVPSAQCRNDRADRGMVATVMDAFTDAFGEEFVHETSPKAGSEDFGCFAQAAGVPSVFWNFGGFDPTLYPDGPNRAHTAVAAGRAPS